MRAVNLLPVERRGPHKRKYFRAANRATVGLGVAFALAVSAVGYLAHSENATIAKRQQRLDALQQQLAAIPQQKPTGAFPGADARVSAVSGVVAKRIAWDDLLFDFSRVIPEDVWLLSLSATSPTAPRTGPPPTTGTAAPTAFTVTGYTYSQKAVARLMNRLALVPWLQNVQLQSSAKSAIEKRTVYQFTVGADIVQPGASS